MNLPQADNLHRSSVKDADKPVSTEELVYQGYLQRDGKAAAERWQATRRPVEAIEKVYKTKQPGWQHTARATDAFRKQALADLLERVKGRDLFGQKALRLAEEIIGLTERQKLGRSYPLVLLFVKGALEDGRRPGERGEHDYHVLSNLPSLGVLCAAVTGRETSYNEKTVRRWLSPTAPHAKALRCWLGWRHWYTDTLLEYRRGTDPETGEAYLTGQSRGPVVGGTLFRLRLRPLADISEERLKACNDKRPSILQPLKPQLQRDWRDLERDRHEGKTWGRSEHSVPLELINVRVEEKRTSDTDSKHCGLLYLGDDQNKEQPLTLLTSQSYLYPDIATEAGAAQLRLDVEHTANWLLESIEGGVTEARRHALLNRYRHAVWTAYKAHRYGNTREGFELLKFARVLAREVRFTQQGLLEQARKPSILDVPAFVWSVIEKRGFQELRRDYGGYQAGRCLRVFTPGMAKKLGIVKGVL